MMFCAMGVPCRPKKTIIKSFVAFGHKKAHKKCQDQISLTLELRICFVTFRAVESSFG